MNPTILGLKAQGILIRFLYILPNLPCASQNARLAIPSEGFPKSCIRVLQCVRSGFPGSMCRCCLYPGLSIPLQKAFAVQSIP